MTRYRNALPQLDGDLFLTDGGIETTLIFHEGLELPYFAAFHLFETPEGEAALRKYFRRYAELARRFNAGLILESATWRANAEPMAQAGRHSTTDLVSFIASSRVPCKRLGSKRFKLGRTRYRL